MSEEASEEGLDELDRRVLDYLKEETWPVTTEMVAEAVGVAWNTAQVHLYKLLASRRVVSKKVGRQNQWMLAGRLPPQ